MSQIAEIILLADEPDEVMTPLLDTGRFTPIPGIGGWCGEYIRAYRWAPLFPLLESMAWTNPAAVRLLVHDEGDDAAGLWTFTEAGRLTESTLPTVTRLGPPIPTDGTPPRTRSSLVARVDPPAATTSEGGRPDPGRVLPDPRRALLLSAYCDEVEARLVRDGGPWPGRFVPLPSQWGDDVGLGYGVAITFPAGTDATGLLPYVESLPWPRPQSVQLLLSTAESPAFTLWMLAGDSFEPVRG